MTQTTFDMMKDLPDRIEELIVGEAHHVFPNDVVVCVLTAENGCAFVGHCVIDLGDLVFAKAVAREEAKNKLVKFECYLTAQRIFEGHPGIDWAKNPHQEQSGIEYLNNPVTCSSDGTDAGN